MRYASVFAVVGVLGVVTIGLAQSSCDAQSAAMGLFAKKGLNLLSPARDYIQPGGLFFLAKGATPDYEDPYDKPTAKDGNLMDFKADIMQEASQKKTTLSAALSLAKAILPLSLAATENSGQDTSLGEIATTGQRMTTQDLDKFLKQQNTAKAAMDGLNQASPKLRVFVVQEVYKATSLKLNGDRTKGLSLQFNNGKVDMCKPASDSSTKETTKGKDTTKGKNDSTKQQSGANAAATTTKGTGQKGTSPAVTATDGTSNIQAGVSVCLTDTYSVTMNAKDPIPFAVRLEELQISGTGIARIRGGKTLAIALGGPSVISADLVDENTPVMAEIQHGTRRRN